MSFARRLKTVNFELFWLSQPSFRQPLTDIFSLVSLKLKNLTILRVFNNSTVASKFLKQQNIYISPLNKNLV
jgi:hypothetical protein